MSGSVADVPRRELALHLDASWVVPAGKKTQIAIFGGPSYFQVRQGLVTDVTTSSVYPYDTATFVGATTAQLSQSHLGFNAGVDITARVSKAVGVGAIVRYSRASLQFPVSAGQEVADTGGRIAGRRRRALCFLAQSSSSSSFAPCPATIQKLFRRADDSSCYDFWCDSVRRQHATPLPRAASDGPSFDSSL